jgi:Family of unknown function (DUF6527)
MVLKKLFNWFLSFLKLKKEDTQGCYNLAIVSELPETLSDDILYIEGNEKLNDYWYALLICPCGCQENIMLNLMDDAKPYWKVSINKSDFSISPSIWRTKNCKSHFWLKNRKIVWV